MCVGNSMSSAMSNYQLYENFVNGGENYLKFWGIQYIALGFFHANEMEDDGDLEGFRNLISEDNDGLIPIAPEITIGP